MWFNANCKFNDIGGIVEKSGTNSKKKKGNFFPKLPFPAKLGANKVF
jgi:hypothetical protein